MKLRHILIFLLTQLAVTVFGRMFVVTELKTLIADSKLVFVGRVKSVTLSDIKTTLSYVPWDGVTFRWLLTHVEVLEPIKGVRKGDIIQAAMLSVDPASQSQPIYSPPGMLEPDVGDVFLLCLVETPRTNLFAALRGPYDENLSAFLLHRFTPGKDPGSGRRWHVLSDDQRFAPVWAITNKKGELNSRSVASLRDAFAAEIRHTPSNRVVFLEWQTHTNRSGWRSDSPKGVSWGTNASQR